MSRAEARQRKAPRDTSAIATMCHASFDGATGLQQIVVVDGYESKRCALLSGTRRSCALFVMTCTCGVSHPEHVGLIASRHAGNLSRFGHISHPASTVLHFRLYRSCDKGFGGQPARSGGAS